MKRRVTYKEYIKSDSGKWKPQDRGEADFLEFGLDSDEHHIWSAAILELDDGQVKVVPAENIRFISKYTLEDEELAKQRRDALRR